MRGALVFPSLEVDRDNLVRHVFLLADESNATSAGRLRDTVDFQDHFGKRTRIQRGCNLASGDCVVKLKTDSGRPFLYSSRIRLRLSTDSMLIRCRVSVSNIRLGSESAYNAADASRIFSSTSLDACYPSEPTR